MLLPHPHALSQLLPASLRRRKQSEEHSPRLSPHLPVFFVYNFINFIFACTGSLLLCRAFSNCSERGLLFMVVLGPLIAVASLIPRAQALGTWASVVVAHRLSSCPMGREIFPDQGSNSCPLHWQADFYLLCHQGNPHLYQSFAPAPTFSVHVAFSYRWTIHAPLGSQSWIDPTASILLKNATLATLFSFLHHQS